MMLQAYKKLKNQFWAMTPSLIYLIMMLQAKTKLNNQFLSIDPLLNIAYYDAASNELA